MAGALVKSIHLMDVSSETAIDSSVWLLLVYGTSSYRITN